MALTREDLREMGLSDDQIEMVIEGHTETVTGLTQERDRLNAELQQAQGDAEQARNELQSYRQQVEAERQMDSKTTALRGALKEAGVQREDFVELLMMAVDMETVELDGDKIKDAAALIDPLRQTYGGCFITTTTEGVDTVNPPVGGSNMLTREQIANMSEDEINANWPAVQVTIGQT